MCPTEPRAVRRKSAGTAGNAGLQTGTAASEVAFPSVRGDRLSDVAIAKLIRELGIGTVPHGFRSSFRDWAAERTDAPREVCGLALAHVNTNAIEAASQRSELFERRPVLMEQWAVFRPD